MTDLELLNQVVGHPVFGQGVITGSSSGKRLIEFNTDEKRFQYPEAFERFLAFDDPLLQSRALAELHKKKEIKSLE